MSVATTQILNLPVPPTDQESSPTYSIQGQSNTARLGEVIPIHYGRHVLWPDPVMTPYREYEGDVEWYYFLGCAGIGKISTEQWRFGDVYLDQLPAADRQYETRYPGTVPTLVPATVYSAPHGSIELTQVPSAGTVANPANTTVTVLAADVELAGLGYNNDDGTIASRTVTVRMETRTLDAAGTALTAWALQASLAITGAQKEPVRRTLKATLPAARHEMRLYVAAAPGTDSRQMDRVIWSGARGYDYIHPNYGNVTLCALKIKAVAMTAGSGQTLSVIGTRWIQHWDGSAWTAAQASRSIVWALVDAYLRICGLPPDTLDMAGLLAMHNRLEVLGFKFDYRFDQGVSLLAAMQVIARAGRCQLVQVNGIWTLVRDE
ncbi:MAG TPA: hypothetical protein PLN94_16620, partial [Thiolinea sp.]|nr:hypothetical protein [Thiolinea sp.]